MALLSLLVIARIFASSGLNVVQKRLTTGRLTPLFVVAVGFGILAVILLPVTAIVPLHALPAAFWWNMAVAVLLDAPGNLFLVASVSRSDLSLVSPLNAYKAIVALLLGVLLLGEIPSEIGLVGVGVILMGSMFLAPEGEKMGRRAVVLLARERGVQFRLLSVTLTAGAAIFAKAALAYSSPMQVFMVWAFASAPLMLVALHLVERLSFSEFAAKLRQDGTGLVGIALLYVAMQVLTLTILDRMFVGYALALFQLSAVVNVGLGYLLFRERNVLQRAVGSLVMIAGAAVLILKG